MDQRSITQISCMTSGYPILSDSASFQLLTLAFGRDFTINTLEVNIIFTNFHPEQ